MEIKHFDVVLRLLLESAEHQEEIPDIHSYLNAVGVALPVLRTVDQLDVGLRWNRHRVHSVMGMGQGNQEEVRLSLTALRMTRCHEKWGIPNSWDCIKKRVVSLPSPV